MASDCVTDTHGLIWYLEDSPQLGLQAQRAFEVCDQGDCFIYVPTICLVEMVYLQEKAGLPPSWSANFRLNLPLATPGCYWQT